MKIELDVSEGQLAKLDKSLNDFLSTLTDDQKLTLLQGYIKDIFSDSIYRESTSYYSSCKELTDFGKQLINGIKNQIANLYVENYYMNNEELRDRLDKECEKVQDNIRNIINDSIAAYVANNLFSNTDKVQFMISRQVQDLVNRLDHPNYY